VYGFGGLAGDAGAAEECIELAKPKKVKHN
jgi:hypothetical protein